MYCFDVWTWCISILCILWYQRKGWDPNVYLYPMYGIGWLGCCIWSNDGVRCDGWDANTSVDYKTNMARADNWELIALAPGAADSRSDLLFSVKKLGLLTLMSLSLSFWYGKWKCNPDIHLPTSPYIPSIKTLLLVRLILSKVNLNSSHIHQSTSNRVLIKWMNHNLKFEFIFNWKQRLIWMHWSCITTLLLIQYHYHSLHSEVKTAFRHVLTK